MILHYYHWTMRLRSCWVPLSSQARSLTPLYSFQRFALMSPSSKLIAGIHNPLRPSASARAPSWVPTPYSKGPCYIGQRLLCRTRVSRWPEEQVESASLRRRCRSFFAKLWESACTIESRSSTKPARRPRSCSPAYRSVLLASAPGGLTSVFNAVGGIKEDHIR